MVALKKGDKLACTECGMEVEVTKSCTCKDECDCKVICCEKPMVVAEKQGGCSCCCSG